MVEHINHLSRKLPVWLIYIIGVAPGVYFIMLGIRNELGPEPIAKLEHLLGEFALQMLILGWRSHRCAVSCGSICLSSGGQLD